MCLQELMHTTVRSVQCYKHAKSLSFDGVSLYCQAVLGVLDSKWLQLLSINCNTVEADQDKGQVDEQSRQVQNQKSKINRPINTKTNKEMNCFLAGQKKNQAWCQVQKSLKELHGKYNNVFFRHWMLQSTFSLQGKDSTKLCKAPAKHVLYTLQESFKKNTRELSSKQLNDVTAL